MQDRRKERARSLNEALAKVASVGAVVNELQSKGEWLESSVTQAELPSPREHGLTVLASLPMTGVGALSQDISRRLVEAEKDVADLLVSFMKHTRNALNRSLTSKQLFGWCLTYVRRRVKRAEEATLPGVHLPARMKA